MLFSENFHHVYKTKILDNYDYVALYACGHRLPLGSIHVLGHQAITWTNVD